MGAIANRYSIEESAVLAVEAGADVLLMPLDAERAIHAVCAAVTANRIAPERIRASVERIWHAKLKVCFPTETTSLMSQLAQPSAIATNTKILQASMRVHHPTPSRLDHLPDTGRNLILMDDGIDCDFLGRTAPAIAIPSQFKFTRVEVIDCYTPPISFDSNLTNSYPTLLQLFIRGNPFRGSAGLTEAAQDWVKFLLKSQQLQALIIYGSPYVLEQFLPLLPSEVPYVFSYGQMQLAQKIAITALFPQKNRGTIAPLQF